MGMPARETAVHDLTIKASEQDGVHRIALGGELDLASSWNLVDAASQRCRQGAKQLVLDIGELDFIDSTGLRMILEQWNRFRADGLDLSILPGSGQVQRVFAMTGLAELLPFADGASPR